MKDEKIIFLHCRLLYRLGLGNFWFEDGFKGNSGSVCYNIYGTIVLLIALITVTMEVLAGLFSEYPTEKKLDSVILGISHSLDALKVCSVLIKKEKIKQLSKDLIKLCSTYENEESVRKKYTSIKLNTYAYVFFIYGASAFYISESIRNVLVNDDPFLTVFTYYPKYEDRSTMAEVMRIGATASVIALLMHLMWIDNLAVTFLIIIKYKFFTLGSYFENIMNDWKDSKSCREYSDVFKDRFVNGIKMHQELLRVTKEMNKVFALHLSLHLCQSYGSVVTMLLSLALTKTLEFTLVAKLLFFMLGIIFLLGVFFCNAGEITYQASELSTSIYKCGWEDCRKDVGKLVIIACTACRKPLVLKAFALFDMTYASFITVVRGIYSVFTLLLRVRDK